LHVVLGKDKSCKVHLQKVYLILSTYLFVVVKSKYKIIINGIKKKIIEEEIPGEIQIIWKD